MKKIFMTVLLGLSLVGCSVDLDTGSLKQKFPEYYDLGTFKGLEVYAWKNGNLWSTGAMGGTNRFKTPDEINQLKPATLSEMKAIISSYDIPHEDIIILLIDYPVADNYQVIVDKENPSIKMIESVLKN